MLRGRRGTPSDGRPLPQVFKAQQHGKHALELAIEMNLVATEPLQLVGVERLAEGVLADQGKFGCREGRFRVFTGP
jgi:hypothetical protein